MCKTSTKVLNINFSESQTGVKGRKPRVSIHLTIRRERERESCHLFITPPSFKDSAPPLADPCGQSSTRSAAAAPAGNNFHSVRKVDETLGKKEAVPGRLGREVGDAPEASAGYKRCSPWWRRSQHPGGTWVLKIHSSAPEPCSYPCAHTPPPLTCSRPPSAATLSDCCRADGGRGQSSLFNTPSCLLSSCPLIIHGGCGRSVQGVTQELEITYDEANSKRLYWLDVFRI